MVRIDKLTWERLSPLLDEVLDLEGEARDRYLAARRAHSPDQARALEQMLEAYDRAIACNFLDHDLTVGPWAAAQRARSDVEPRAEGERFGHYRILRVLGRGGMGTVYEAEQDAPRRIVALKVVRPTHLGPESLRRFEREAQALGRLQHPGIAHIHEAGSAETPLGVQPFFTMELVRGEPLVPFANTRRLSVRQRLELMLRVCDAVEHAHQRGIVHRDLKPANILVDDRGQPKVLDFGVARFADGEMQVTRDADAGQLIGTLAYMSPEQLSGDAEAVDPRSDVYALGVMLYELLAARLPHPSTGRVHEVVRAIREDDPPALGTIVPALRGDVDTLVAKALKKDPDERYTVGALAEDLRRFLGHQPIRARPDTLTYRARKFVRRHRLAVAASVLTVASLGTGLFVATRERARAEARFQEVRQLATRLFDIETEVRELPGSSKVRQMIVEASLDYLRKLAVDDASDPELALEVGTAYLRAARVQGVPIGANLGQTDQAADSLQRAASLVSQTLAATPDNRTAHLRMAQISHDRMVLAALARPDAGSTALARVAADCLVKYLDAGPPDPDDVAQVLVVASNVVGRFRAARLYDDALKLNERTLALAEHLPIEAARVGILLNDRAMIHRERGDLDAALADIGRAAELQEPSISQAGQSAVLNYVLTLLRLASVVGSPSEVSLGRTAEARAPLERAFALADDIVHRSPGDTNSRGRLATVGRALAELYHDADPARAVALYDHVLDHLKENGDYPRFRRDEARTWAASAAPLRALGRTGEASKRIEEALAQLRRLKLFPTETIELGSEADQVLRALAAHEAETQGPQQGLARYREIIGLSPLDADVFDGDLSDAAEASRLLEAAGALARRAHQQEMADTFDDRRAALWRDWAQRLPDSAFVARERQRADRGLPTMAARRDAPR